jgi:hypothetical protein
MKSWNYFHVIKFLRFDSINTFFKSIKNNLKNLIDNFITRPILKVVLHNLNEIFTFLFLFVLYAHFMTCIYVRYNQEGDSLDQIHFNKKDYYISTLYATFTTFTNVGFGEITPDISSHDAWKSQLIFMINMFFGFVLFCIVTFRIKEMFNSLKSYKKEKKVIYEFQKFIFNLQKGSGKVVSKNLKNLIYSHNVINRGLSFSDIFVKYKKILRNCRQDLKYEITNNMFDHLKKEYSIFFKDCSQNFMMKIFSKLVPKTFKPGKILIDLNKKVDKLHFLYYGEIHILNKNNQRFIDIKNCSIFGDWYFHSQTYSDYLYKVSNSKCAVGFILKKNHYLKIAKEDIISAREFSIKSYYKLNVYKDLEKDQVEDTRKGNYF